MYKKNEIIELFSKTRTITEFYTLCSWFSMLIEFGLMQPSAFLYQISHVYFRKILNLTDYEKN